MLSAKVVGERRIDLRKRDWIESNKHKRWIGFNEYCAYLHSRIDIVPTGGFKILVNYNPHYCAHFAGNPSYRPTFRSKWFISLIGALGSFIMMFQMAPLYALFAVVFATI